ncbi:adenine phosphoribosyltransferase [Microlunatus flavus]|uniref:Adenine phosphoribosyltransferase n=1 Tax=Microlunatus flavus TaxID=1036181 RepID=A0A1H9FCJ4_9ACTN|nr:adenine phosphoribosyltransferase [Microlunatus flavus]SEQ35644.1 adenine phosphoribosyltransferase [Microlunatus flavus]
MGPAGLAELVVDVPDFPKPGVTFKDITPLLADPVGLAAAVEGLAAVAPEGVDAVVALEARGFIFGGPVALALGVGFVPVRKPNKLPRAHVDVTYDLEYGTETLALHADALQPGQRVLVVDDVLATGGTLVAASGLVRRLGAEVAAVAVVLELGFLDGRRRLAEAGVTDVRALISSGGA